MTKKHNTTTKAKKTNSQAKKNMAKDVKTEQTKKQESVDKEAEIPEVQSEATVAEPEANENSKKIEELQASANDWKDKYLRLSAEFDNYRKRTLKEKSDLILTANQDLLHDILPVVDDFERGMASIDKSEDVDALRKGVHLIYNKFSEFLKQKGIREIEALEQDFDLDFHEALTKIPAPDEALKGKVVDVIEKGYLLNDKVIRYSKVVVGE